MQGTLHVAGHIDFGYYIDVALGCIADDIAAFLLCVVTTIRNVVIDAHVARTDDGLLAYTAFQRQIRISFHFKTPTLILSQMPVKLVTAVQCHCVQELLDEFYCKEVTSAVE